MTCGIALGSHGAVYETPTSTNAMIRNTKLSKVEPRGSKHRPYTVACLCAPRAMHSVQRARRIFVYTMHS
jgi:hypothetical protein